MSKQVVIPGTLMVVLFLGALLSGCGPATRQQQQTEVQYDQPTHEPVATKLVPAPEPTTIVTYPGVRAGAYCSQRGALGTTPTGEAVRCTNSSTDPSYRWRKLQGE